MSDLHRWQLQYLGTPTFPKNITVVELQAFFTYSEIELAALRTRYKSDLRIAAGVQLGFLKMTGTPLETVLVIPPNLLRYVGKQLGARQLTIASLRALYKKRPRTLYEHQSWAMEQLGFSRATLKQFAHLLEYLRVEALVAPSVDALVERGMAWMYQRKFLYPGDRPIRDYARQALGASDEGLLKMIREAAPGDTLREWELAALRTRPGTGGSNLEWLQEAPRRNSATALRETMDRIEPPRVFRRLPGLSQAAIGN